MTLPPQPSSNSFEKSIRGDINSGIFDTGATSSCGRTGDKFQSTTQKSHKIFHIPTGKIIAASTQSKLYQDVHEPAKTVDMVPELKRKLLIIRGKFADEKYITVLTPTEVLIYDGNDILISVYKEAILRGWKDTATGLWHVPLQPNVQPPSLNSFFLKSSARKQ